MTNKKWFCTPDAETKKGISGYRFYLATKRNYESDVELSPSPWVHAEALDSEKDFFFTSRDIAYPEITKRLGEIERLILHPCYVCSIIFDDKLLYPVVDDNDEKTGEYICHECLNNDEEELFPL